MEKILHQALEKVQAALWEISEAMYHHPELGDEEFESVKRLTKLLSQYDFEIEMNIVGRPTAFKATYQSNKPGPVVAYLAEYDALPGVGHGCGHNLIGTMSVGAAILLRQILDEIGGTVHVFGTPAEETNGAKVPMSEQGVFANVDVAMILHPDGQSVQSGTALAVDALQFTYTGKASHAAGAPEQGVNALDSVIQLFNGINALREHVTSDVRMHGIIPQGGEAANIVPDLAIAQFYVRAARRETLDDVVLKVKNIAHGAAQMTGASLEITNYQISYDNMVTNEALSTAFNKILEEVTREEILPPRKNTGSIDMGNVSRVVPSIHPHIGMKNPALIPHTKAFADTTITKVGKQTLVDGALALALTGKEVITNHTLLEEIKTEFIQMKQS